MNAPEGVAQAAYQPSGDALWYAPRCRDNEHRPRAHHDRLNDRCDCPCHLDRPGTPWWFDHRAASLGSADPRAV